MSGRGRDVSAADTRAELARRISAHSRVTGEFRLRSGAISDTYFDKYLFEGDPQLLHAIAAELVKLLPEELDAIAGIELGGVPLATVCSQLCGLPTLFVRKQAKQYGTCALAEGGPVAERRLAVIEDVVTSGGQVLDSCQRLRERGAEISAVVCVIDRETGAVDSLAEASLQLRSLFTAGDLERAVREDPLTA
jgi:orotate phosphoribosyltransferase